MDTNLKTLSDYSRYLICSTGKVFDKKLDKYISFQKTIDGYLCVTLRSDSDKRKTFKVHRLVAFCYIENTENKPTVNHKDGNKENNSVSNLEWSTRSEQVQHAWDTGLIKNMQARKQGIRNHSGKKVLCVTTGEVFDSIGHAAESKSVLKSNLSACCNGKVGYKSAGKTEDGIKLIWRFYE
jgi:hypothetical protein